MTQELERRAAELRTLPALAFTVTGSGLAATDRAAEELPAADDPRCGVLTRSHPYGGSVIDGYRTEVLVILADALVAAEDYDPESSGTSWVHVFAADPDRRAALGALVRAALGDAVIARR
ncbi:MAG: hypothetical protein IPH44_27040 [Myxococcales bacterium]|nr:hypothetical protein [Myxococcales bacterium]MBK7196345.1 hypothetical protein [Myxococcales bacterium]MBP6847815.1 hypothetical protein [Kofleriaceae bacterium]